MDINSANMTELFKAFKVAFSDGMQATGQRASPEDILVDELAMIGTSTTTAAVHAWLNQIPSIRKWVGDRILNNVASNKLEVTNEDYENTIAMPRAAIRDDQYGLYTPLVRALGIDAGNLWLKLGINALIANGTWIDGKAFFAADRVYGAQTIANLSGAALSETTFDAALTALRSFKGHNGEPLEVAPRTLLVGPKLRQTGWDLVKNNFRVGGTTNKAGAVQNSFVGLCDLRVSGRLVGDADDYWFVLGEKGGIRPVYVQKREEPVLTSLDREDDDHVFKRNEFLYGARASGAAFLTLPHLAYAGIL